FIRCHPPPQLLLADLWFEIVLVGVELGGEATENFSSGITELYGFRRVAQFLGEGSVQGHPAHRTSSGRLLTPYCTRPRPAGSSPWKPHSPNAASVSPTLNFRSM